MDASTARPTPIPDRAFIAARLAAGLPLEALLTSDDVERHQALEEHAARAAAVLLLIVGRERPTVVFTRRTAHLADHAGQISFPGGRRDEGDLTPEANALRESHEEVGLDAKSVEILGRLPDYRTVTGYTVVPIVGWIDPPLELHPDPHEVEEVFEVPLDFLLDASNHRQETAYIRGQLRRYWAMPYGDHYIWGATAGMLVTFQRVLAGG